MTAASVIEALRPRFGDRIATSHAIRDQHSRDMSRLPPCLPDAVVWPETEAEVQDILRQCHAAGVPVIPYGAGSSMEGHTIPVRNGITVNTSRMNRIREIAAEDLLAVVEPGVTRLQLNTDLRATGLTFPIDPGADASLGGMASTRGSGTMAVRYGTMRENVLALRVVLPDGRVIRTGSRARKSSTGYDLTHLIVGSEGTLGIITELTVRLHPVPEAVSAAICAFPSVRAAVEAVIETVQSGIPVARVEFLDQVAIANVNSHSGLTLPVAPTLLFEFHGSPAWVDEQARTVQDITESHQASAFRWSSEADERRVLWQARHDLYWATRAMRPGAAIYTGDICVPISRLADAIESARDDIDASSLPGQIIGHVGDGNFHTAYLFDPDNPEEVAEAERLAHRLAERALAAGGTVSGEHGIGAGKLGLMREEHGDAVDVMKAVKAALDPRGIMNPGKMGDAG